MDKASSEELSAVVCEVLDADAPEHHPLWPVAVALFDLEHGHAPRDAYDLYAVACCPAHF